MSDYNYIYHEPDSIEVIKKDKKNYFIHSSLFILTFITTTIAGAQWITGIYNQYHYSFFLIGLPYSISIMFIISCHEFGHYFAAQYHKIKSTLPFYIPFPPVPFFLNFGTMGAVIRTKSPIYSKKAMFDIGIAGPLAGFAACLIVLIYGFTHVPGADYLITIHPEYFSTGVASAPVEKLVFGNTLLFSFLKLVFIHGSQAFPPMSEIYRYPYLCVGWFGLFITAMNMIPVGQLDGGHIAYTMFGERNHYKIAVVSFVILIVLGLIGFAESYFEFSTSFGWVGWLLWALLLFFIIKLKHPIVPDYNELDGKRKILGYISFLILIVSFSPNPFMITLGQ